MRVTTDFFKADRLSMASGAKIVVRVTNWNGASASDKFVELVGINDAPVIVNLANVEFIEKGYIRRSTDNGEDRDEFLPDTIDNQAWYDRYQEKHS